MMHLAFLSRLPMPRSDSRPASAPGWVVKLQILAGVFVPMLALAIWLRSQGFW